MSEPRPMSYPDRLRALAQEKPNSPMVTVATATGEVTTTRAEVAAWSDQIAAQLGEFNPTADTLVVLATRNSAWFYAAVHAAWDRGCTVLPVGRGMSDDARARVCQAAGARWPHVLEMAESLPHDEPGALAEVGPAHARTTIVERSRADEPSSGPAASEGVGPGSCEQIVPRPGFAFLSGGSTGEPKIIVNDSEHLATPADGPLAGVPGLVGMTSRQVQLVAGPLFHGAPASWSTLGLFHGHHLVVMDRFDAARAVSLIERHGVQWAFLVPTMMRRMALLPTVSSRALASLEGVCHASAPCPPAVKDAWLALIAPERLYEGFGGTEAAGASVIRGDQWLAHRGSVGLPVPGWEATILNDAGRELAPGEVGLIHFRATDGPQRKFSYVGAVEQVTDDGWVTLGDLGWKDAEGYLFVADRRTDLIISGGANVFPAEVEAVLLEHPGVVDVAVVGREDPDLGRRVVAVVEPRRQGPPTATDLSGFCERTLPRYKVPREYLFVDRLPRNEQGKLRRTELLAQIEA